MEWNYGAGVAKKKKPPGRRLAKLTGCSSWRRGRPAGFGGLDGLVLALQIGQPACALQRLVVLFAHISLYFDTVFRLCVATMVIRLTRFNTYLLAAALIGLLTGCETASSKSKKQLATLRVHLEAGGDMGGRGEKVTISRAANITLNIDKYPVLNESLVKQAGVVDVMGGFMMVIEFDNRGKLMLEQLTASNPGKHFVIAAQFGEKDKATQRWLAAPLISRRMADGTLSFTPDATRAEAEEIARGLNNVAIENGNQEKPKNKGKTKEADTTP